LTRALFVVFVCLAFVLDPSGAQAKFTVPTIEGHVTDTAHALSPDDRVRVEERLTRYMDELGIEIAVLIPASLEGETIEDVAYETFNAWKIGRAKLDNGVLLVIAPAEHRIRIETGKGVGGRLTDLQSSDIIDQRIAPKLRVNDYRGAVEDGVDSIAAALGSTKAPVPAPAAQQRPSAPLLIGMTLLFVVFVLVRMRFGGWWFFGGGRRGGGMGGIGGGGYSGGGGRSGGGGASGRW
jgi:uncharacterized protein